MMKIDTLHCIALGNILPLIEKTDFWTSMIELAETKDEANRYARRCLKYKAKAIIEFDREMDTLTKGQRK